MANRHCLWVVERAVQEELAALVGLLEEVVMEAWATRYLEALGVLLVVMEA